MDLSAPKTITFVIAVIIAMLAALSALGVVTFIPIAVGLADGHRLRRAGGGLPAQGSVGDLDSTLRGRERAGEIIGRLRISDQTIELDRSRRH